MPKPVVTKRQSRTTTKATGKATRRTELAFRPTSVLASTKATGRMDSVTARVS